MRRILLLLLILPGVVAQAQIKNPVKWHTEILHQGSSKVTLVVKATIERGWHVYSQHLERNDGPIATTVNFEPNQGYSLVSNTTESATLSAFDSSYSMTLRYFENRATFSQAIKLHTKQPLSIRATVRYMVCNNTDCLPPNELSFTFPLNGFNKKIGSTAAGLGQAKPETILKRPSTRVSVPETSWEIFVAGFTGGLLALLTPYIFPIWQSSRFVQKRPLAPC